MTERDKHSIMNLTEEVVSLSLQSMKKVQERKFVMVVESVQELFDFIEQSPSCFHVIDNAKKMLEKEGFEELCENKKWEIGEIKRKRF